MQVIVKAKARSSPPTRPSKSEGEGALKAAHAVGRSGACQARATHVGPPPGLRRRPAAEITSAAAAGPLAPRMQSWYARRRAAAGAASAQHSALDGGAGHPLAVLCAAASTAPRRPRAQSAERCRVCCRDSSGGRTRHAFSGKTCASCPNPPPRAVVLWKTLLAKNESDEFLFFLNHVFHEDVAKHTSSRASSRRLPRKHADLAPPAAWKACAQGRARCRSGDGSASHHERSGAVASVLGS